MTSSKLKKRSQPVVEYQVSDDIGEQLNRAFDILFEETLKQMSDLTANDN